MQSLNSLCVYWGLAGCLCCAGCFGGPQGNPPPESMQINDAGVLRIYVEDLARDPTPDRLELILEHLQQSEQQNFGPHAEAVAKIKQLAQDCQDKIGTPGAKSIIGEMLALAKTLPEEMLDQ